MQTIQQSVRTGLMRPFRKFGLAAARHWPWPVGVRISNGRRMYVDLRSGVSRGIFAKGEFDPKVFEPLRGVLQPGGTFLDVGANVGFYSMLALDAVGLGGAVHAFEMDERPRRCLRKTIAHERIPNLSLHEFAVGNRDGHIGVAMHADSGNSGVVQTGGQRQIAMRKLDTWWHESGAKKIQGMKLDIEGAELLALQGAERMLRAERPLIVCEADEELQGRFGYEPKQLLDQFAALHYRVEPLAGTWSPTMVAYPA
ncbi:MAG: FkbM family methyltransferase [Verrucomicrobia bacterium]|nr:FkbM family methyltransferase [Verrucomicrobiota bacterium]